MITNLLIINDLVKDYQIFIDSLNQDTTYIVVSCLETRESFFNKLNSVSINNLTNIALVFDNTGNLAPYFEATDQELLEHQQKQAEYDANLAQYEIQLEEYNKIRNPNPDNAPIPPVPYMGITPSFLSSGLFFSPIMMNVLQTLKDDHPTLEILDLITCNVIPDSEFDTLTSMGIKTRYSTDITGYGGNWILESDNVNVTPIYFTNNISTYPYILGGVAPNTQDGSGRWELKTPDNLYWLMTATSTGPGAPNLNSSYILFNNIDMTGYAFPSESIAKRQGGSYVPFRGKFEGNNKTITIGSVVAGYQGLFWAIDTGNNIATPEVNITNLTVNYTTNLTMLNNVNTDSVGSLVGYVYSGALTNCTVNINGNLSITTTNAAVNSGALVGYYYNGTSPTYGSITNCNVTINGNFTCSTGTTSYSGGLVGFNWINATTTNNGNMTSCNLVITGTLSITSTGTSNSNSGGLCGFLYNQTASTNITVSNCTASIGNISFNGGLTQGSLIGNNLNCQILNTSVTVNNVYLYNPTTVTVTRLGGFIGTNQSTIAGPIVQNCSLTINGACFIDAAQAPDLGVFCGTNTCPIDSCSLLVKGAITLKTIVGLAYIGGFCGANSRLISNTNTTFLKNSIFSSISPGANSLMGSFVGEDTSLAGTYLNNTINYYGQTIFQNKSNTGLKLASPIGNRQLTTSPNIYVAFFGTPFIFYNPNSTSIIHNGITYNVVSVFTYLNLQIDVTDLTVTIDTINNQLSFISPDPPCPLNPNVCTNDPLTSNLNDSAVTVREGGCTINRNMNNIYYGIATGAKTAYSEPIFKDYYSYMMWLQSRYK